MSCNCKAEIDARLKARLIEEHPEGKDHKASLGGYGFVINGNSLALRATLPYETEVMTTTKAGKPKPVKVKGSMLASYCPFCGKPWKKEGETT